MVNTVGLVSISQHRWDSRFPLSIRKTLQSGHSRVNSIGVTAKKIAVNLKLILKPSLKGRFSTLRRISSKVHPFKNYISCRNVDDFNLTFVAFVRSNASNLAVILLKK